jgi:hypothetical protein
MAITVFNFEKVEIGGERRDIDGGFRKKDK